MKRRALLCTAVLVVFAANVMSGIANAQTYPDHGIRFVVPYSPGGGADIVARLLARKLSQSLAVPVVVDNRAGAGGIIGTKLVSDATPDGYTLLLGNVGPLAIGPSLYKKKLPYDPARDFAPVSLLAVYPNLLVVHPSLPARSLQDFISLAKAHPRQLTFASAGIGSSTHLAAELIFTLAGIHVTHVPYKDVGLAFTDLVQGRVDAYFGSPLRALPFIKSGKLRPLVITGSKRLESQPNWPTVAESGFPGYEAYNWLGVLVPKGTPTPIIEHLSREIVNAFQQSEVRRQLEAQAGEARTNSPQEFAKFISTETKKWAKVVKDSGAQIN